MTSLAGTVMGLSTWTSPLAASTPWWNAHMGGWIGGIGGSLVGLCGAVVGICAGIGRGRAVALTLLRLLIVIGSVTFVAGVIALLMGQPYAVYYPLLLLGGIVLLVAGANNRGVRRRYREIELRKMQAEDIS